MTASQMRDKMKARAFNSMWQNKTLPDAVLARIDEISASKSKGTNTTASVGFIYDMGGGEG